MMGIATFEGRFLYMEEKNTEKVKNLCAKQLDAVETLAVISMELLVRMGVNDKDVAKISKELSSAEDVSMKVLDMMADEIGGIFKDDNVCGHAALDIVMMGLVRKWSTMRAHLIKEGVEELDKVLSKEVGEIKKRLGIEE